MSQVNATKKYSFLIARKRMIKETDKSYTFTTKRFNGYVFNIPKSFVIKFTPDFISISEFNKEEAYIVTIPLWLASKIGMKDIKGLMNEDQFLEL